MTTEQRCIADSGTCATCGDSKTDHEGFCAACIAKGEAAGVERWVYEAAAAHPYVPRPCGAVLVQEQGPFTGAPWVCERGHVL